MKPFVLLLAAIVLAGCASPGAVDMSKVQSIRYVDGKPVYIMKDTEEQRKALLKEAQQTRKEIGGIVFKAGVTKEKTK